MDELRQQTAEALLEAIMKAAPGADGGGRDALESLARAYALVVSAKPTDDASIFFLPN